MDFRWCSFFLFQEVLFTSFPNNSKSLRFFKFLSLFIFLLPSVFFLIILGVLLSFLLLLFSFFLSFFFSIIFLLYLLYRFIVSFSFFLFFCILLCLPLLGFPQA